MTAKDVMARGALLGFLAASFIVRLAVAWATATGAPGLSPQAPGGTDIADMLLLRLAGTPPVRSFVWPGSPYVAREVETGLPLERPAELAPQRGLEPRTR